MKATNLTVFQQNLSAFLRQASREEEVIRVGTELKGAYSRRLNRQHRLVYTVDEERKTVRILAM